MDKTQGIITRDEWTRRYATRIHELAGWAMEEAAEAARVGADMLEQEGEAPWWGSPGEAYNTPEDEADEEMSCWTNDGED